MRSTRTLALVGMLLCGISAAHAQAVRPFETDQSSPVTPLDSLVLASLQEHGLQPARRCSDEVFVRRVYLDMTGALPDPKAVYEFLKSTRADKREALVGSLFDTEGFADCWAMKWCDVLRVKAEFPINLWPNAVQAYHRWVRTAVRDNMPHDQFARALLTSSGSNFREAPVNFYRAAQGRDPASLARAVALTFMGTRLETWPDARRKALEPFFSRIAYKKTGEWKEEIVCLDPGVLEPLDAVLPDGRRVHIAAGEDPREVFADWLISPANEWFARAAVNRVWAWLMGRGIVHEPDDVRPDNPPVNPELLAYLEQALVGANWDLRAVYRLILNSATYQQSSLPRSGSPEAETLFAFYPPRRLDAEVLADALSWLGGEGEEYMSQIPEPFTYTPKTQHTVALSDGSITSQFLESFGRPARDTGLISERSSDPSDAQRLYLLSSKDVQQKVERSPRIGAIVKASSRNHSQLVQWLYLTILSRYPTPGESTAAMASLQGRGRGLGLKQAVDDLAWALVNTKEFLYQH